MLKAMISTRMGETYVTESYGYGDARDMRDKVNNAREGSFINIENIVLPTSDITAITVWDGEELERELEEYGCIVRPDGLVIFPRPHFFNEEVAKDED